MRHPVYVKTRFSAEQSSLFSRTLFVRHFLSASSSIFPFLSRMKGSYGAKIRLSPTLKPPNSTPSANPEPPIYYLLQYAPHKCVSSSLPTSRGKSPISPSENSSLNVVGLRLIFPRPSGAAYHMWVRFNPCKFTTLFPPLYSRDRLQPYVVCLPT